MPTRFDDQQESAEQRNARFRIAYATTARKQLNEEQVVEIAEEEKICVALEEEIDQMKKLQS